MKRIINKKRFQKGFSILEGLIASTILTGVVASAITMQTMTLQRTRSTNDKAFATQKAMQMFEELRAYVQANRENDIAKLQNFSDGASYNHVLTTEKRETATAYGTQAQDLSNPADPLSGNSKIPGSNNWKFLRRVQVSPVANDDNARQVTVSVYYANEQNNAQPKGAVDRPLAVISGILKTNISADPPTQMYDLFVVAIENSPSWWVDMADLRPSFERTLQDLEQRNPGLIFRRHFITRNGFGRDPYYMPYINNANPANAQDLPWAYFYTGEVNNTLGQNFLLDVFQGRRRADTPDELRPLDKEHANYSGNEEYRYYAMADQFNHVLRYPEQKAMEERLKIENPTDYRYNPSLVTFLEDLHNGNTYRNAIVINLHGELLPLPPIRNYSDAAKAPDKHARKLNGDPAAAVPVDGANTTDANFTSLKNKRVVSHPENLQYSNGSTVSWRVYPYEEYPQGQSGLDADNAVATANANRITRNNNSIPQISLFIPTIGAGPRYNGDANGFLQNWPDLLPNASTLDFSTGALTIERMVGGRVAGTTADGFQPYAWWNSTHATLWARPTNNHDISNPAGYLPARIVRAAGSFTIANGASVNTLLLNSNFTQAEENLLKGMLVVLNPDNDGNGVSSNSERVVRITDISNTGGTGRTFTFSPALDTTGGLAAEINNKALVRHKDYDAEIINEPMYGMDLPNQEQRGIRVTLYDTPTRHNAYNNNAPNTAEARGGLRADRQLDGLEYIPAPINGTAFAAGNRDLADMTNLNDTKNTARWRVSLNTAHAGFNNLLNNKTLPLETRIVTTDTTPANCSADPNTRLNELCDGIWGDGDTHLPNDPDTPQNEHQTMLRPNMYNVSRTYTYMNHVFTDAVNNVITASVGSEIPNGTLTIPRVEQAQFQGHPLYNPYSDVKQLNRFNRHFASGLNTNGLSNFDAATGYSWNAVNVDINWFFQLYSTGIMRSNAIFNSISGYSNYYYAFGGEIGTDSTNAVFDVRTQPWSASDTGTATVQNTSATVREIINDGSGGARAIMDSNGTAANRWRMREHLGELFPDDMVAFWRVNGNLPTRDYVDATHNLASGTVTATADRYHRGLVTASPRAVGSTHRRVQNSGAPSFMNGNTETNPTTSDRGLQHSGTGGNAVLTNTAATDAGAQLMNAYNLILSDQIASDRPFVINNTGSSGAYGSPEMRGIRNRLAFVNTTTGTTSASSSTQNVYYRHNSNLTGLTSSAFVKLTRPNPSSPATNFDGLAGYALINGFERAAGSGVMEIARFSQAASLQTFMDAGDRSVPGSASGRVVQLPRVSIREPRSSQVYENPSTIGVDLNIAWLRWDDERYSPAYPGNWRDNTRLVYNIKYSTDNKASWHYADDSSLVPAEHSDIYNASHSVLGGPETSTAANWDKTYSWNVGGLPEGNYVLRVEAYREGFDTGYSYHDVFVTISR